MKRDMCVRLTSLAMILLAAGQTWAAAPPISDPGGLAPAGSMPGTFPTTVTAANVTVEQFVPAVLNGTDSNTLRVSFPSSGPIKWTESRHNEGDLSLNVGPFDPNDASYFPPTTFETSYQPLDGKPFANTTLGWRLNNQTGAALASVRHNGVDYGSTYTFGGSPVGTIHGIAYFNQSGSGYGYRMNDGVFNNGGAGSVDLQMGIAGFDSNQGEASSSTAAAYFPYEQGWTGAWVNGGDDGAAAFGAGSPGLDPSTVSWTGGRATVTLPGVNSATDGMFFVAPTHDGNATNIAAAFPTGGGWNVAVREDEALVPEATLGSAGNGFQFLYVPYTAGGLIGGQINGSSGAPIHAEGDTFFDLTRTAAGKYALSVYAADGVTKLNENQGMIVMSVSGALASDPTIADRAFLSYQYDSGSGNFLIESREVASAGSPNSENQFGDDLALRDANFYFAWVDFTNPLSPTTPIPGDFDNDGDVDDDDLADWTDSFGLDNGADSDGDGDSDGADFLVWQQNLGTGVPGAAAGAAGAVPEPGSFALILLAAAALAAAKRNG